MTALDYHLRKHEKNGDLLKFKQNLEYEKSVEEEIIKRTIKEEEERVLKMAEERKKEEVLFSEVTKVSLKSSQKGLPVIYKYYNFLSFSYFIFILIYELNEFCYVLLYFITFSIHPSFFIFIY